MLRTLILTLLWGLSCLPCSAQKHQLSLAGTYAPWIVLGDNSEYYQSLGSSLGYEYKIGPHATIGIGAQWNRFLDEYKFASDFNVLSTKFSLYAIERQHYSLQNTLRYYFNRAFQKFYLGGFVSYNYLKVTTRNYPSRGGFQSEDANPDNETEIGLGILYGYQYALNSSWNVSLQGSLESSTPDIFLENLGLRQQFNLGLHWRF